MTDDIKKLIEEAKELDAKATAGPWTTYPFSRPEGYDLRVVNEAGTAELGDWLVAGVRWKENAEFIARARTLLPALATTLSAVAGERDQLKADFNSASDEVQRVLDEKAELAAELARAREAFVAILKVTKGTWIEDVHEMRRIAQGQINALAAKEADDE